MSPLEMIKRSTQKREALKAAQMAHLQATAYRGVPYKPSQAEAEPTSARLMYRGIPYND